MNEVFRRHFHRSFLSKHAGVFDKMLKVVQHPVGQTAAGAAAGAGVSLAENKGMEAAGLQVGPVGREGNMIVNMLMGISAGNPWLRKQLYNRVDPVTSKPMEGPGSLHGGKMVSGMTIKGLTGSVPFIADQSIQTIDNIRKATESASQMVGDVQENITGMRTGETPHEASARRYVEGFFRSSLPSVAPPGTALPPPPADAAVSKMWDQYAAAHPEHSAELTKLRDSALKVLPKYVDADVKDRDVGNIVKTVSSTAEGLNSVAQNADDATKVFSGLDKRMDGLEGHFEKLKSQFQPVSDLARWIPENAPKALAYTGGGLLAAGGLYGAYNLFRDWLNYRRVEKEREARRGTTAPKLASLDSFKAMNTPEMVASRHAAVNREHQTAANRMGAAGYAAVQERKALQDMQNQEFTPQGTRRSDIVTAGDGSITIYDRNGRPVGTNRPVTRPQSTGQYGTSPTYPSNPQLGAQIAQQAPGTPKSTAPTPFRVSSPTPAVVAKPTAPVQTPAAAAPVPAVAARPAAPITAPAAPAQAPAPAAAAAPVAKPAPQPAQQPAPPPTITSQPQPQASGGSMLASPGLIPGGVIPPTLQHTSPFIAPGQAAPAPQAPQAPATAVNPALPLQPAPPSNQLDVTANHASSISKTKTAAAAAINWGRVLSGFGGGVAGGGLAYNNAIQSGLSPTEAILPTTIGTLSGGMSGTGIHKARQEGSTLPQAFGKAKVPVMTTLANDMYGAPLWANLKGNILEQKDRLTGTPTADLMKYLGGGALTIAGLAALFQATRAAKRVGDGEPLVNASSTVFAGGSGGPDNPNVGGKVRVMLPTRNPGDNETEVELPLENVPLSGAVLHNIRRDVRRRLRAEGSSRTIPRGSGTSVKTLMAV